MLQSALKVLNLSCEQLCSNLDIKWQLSEYRLVTISAVLLGVPGVELTFFMAAYMLLCFVLVTKTVVIPHQRFGCC